MCERMYLVVKSILNKDGVMESYKIQKDDILKVGRAKFLVRALNTVVDRERMDHRNKRIGKHRVAFRKKQHAQTEKRAVSEN